MKRICLFAGYDSNNIIHSYVIYYITKLSEISDVYYLSDNNMENKELSKLDKITKKSFSFKHGKYDFGSWQEIINKIGWEEIDKYEQLILVNDSCCGPLFDLKDIFNKCESRFDYWGITSSNEIQYHIQSYFIVMNRNVFKSELIRDFFKNIKKEKRFFDIVINYEIGLSKKIIEKNFKLGSYIEFYEIFSQNKPINPCCFISKLISKKMPLIKMKALNGNQIVSEPFDAMIDQIKIHTKYNINLIENYFLLKNINIEENSKKVDLQHLQFNKFLLNLNASKHKKYKNLFNLSLVLNLIFIIFIGFLFRYL